MTWAGAIDGVLRSIRHVFWSTMAVPASTADGEAAYRSRMIPDDTFRAYLERTAAALKAWRGFVTDVATCSVTVEDRTIRVDLAPKTRQACPVELIVHPSQRYDIAVGSEVYEDQPMTGQEDFVPLLTAVTEGRVITRAELSALTERPISVETIITIQPGSEWRRLRRIADAEAQTIYCDHHYLPYRRG